MQGSLVGDIFTLTFFTHANAPIYVRRSSLHIRLPDSRTRPSSLYPVYKFSTFSWRSIMTSLQIIDPHNLDSSPEHAEIERTSPQAAPVSKLSFFLDGIAMDLYFDEKYITVSCAEDSTNNVDRHAKQHRYSSPTPEDEPVSPLTAQNQRDSPLLRLPAELRNLIYDLVLCGYKIHICGRSYVTTACSQNHGAFGSTGSTRTATTKPTIRLTAIRGQTIRIRPSFLYVVL